MELLVLGTGGSDSTISGAWTSTGVDTGRSPSANIRKSSSRLSVNAFLFFFLEPDCNFRLFPSIRFSLLKNSWLTYKNSKCKCIDWPGKSQLWYEFWFNLESRVEIEKCNCKIQISFSFINHVSVRMIHRIMFSTVMIRCDDFYEWINIKNWNRPDSLWHLRF